MNLPALALRRPVTICMVFVCLSLIGVVGGTRLPLEFFPDIDFPGVWIQVPYRNSSPEEVERRIARPIEEAMSTLTGVERMWSESRDNGIGMWVQFGWDEDTTVKGVEARDKIDAIRDQLPDEMGRVQIFKFSAADQPMIVVRLSAQRDLSDAYDMLNRNLKRRVERLSGVSRVTLYGVEPKEVRIELSAQRVAAHGVDLGDLTQRLQRANFALAAGDLTDAGQRFFIRPQGRFRDVAEIGRFVVNDAGLRLSDIAAVRYVDPVLTYGRHLNQRYAVGLDVFKETGANMVAISERVLAEIAQIRQLPEMAGINLYVMHDQAADVKTSLNELMLSGLIGACLSVLVLFGFLRDWCMTLIVTLAVPLSLVITLGAMYFLGYSLNILTLMGLMISVGMLVDNGVVVTESVVNERARPGAQAGPATLRGVNAVALAVAAGTLTTAIVFLPNVFGEPNDISVFMSHVAITICIALAASLLIALTLIPQLTSRLKIGANPQRGSLLGLAAGYARLLRWTTSHSGWTALLILLILASVAIPIQFVKFDMFPQEDSRRLFLRYNLDSQYRLSKVEANVDRIEAYLFENQQRLGIESVYSYFDIGRAESTILLVAEDQRPLAPDEVKKIISEELPSIAIGDPTFDEQRSGSREQLGIRVYGEETEQLRKVAREVARVLKTVDGLSDVRVEAAAADWEVQIQVDRDRVQKHGLDSQTVAESIATAMRGRELRPFQTQSAEIDMVLQFAAADRADLDQLLNLPIRTPAGELVALSSLATLSTQDVPGVVRRENRRTALNIKLGTEDLSAEDARKRVKAVLDQLELPVGYSWDFGEAFDEDAEQAVTMLMNMLLAIACIYIVMAALFESVLAPTAIITGIFFSFIGVFWFFLATGTGFSFMAMIGLLILMGIVVNNGIVMIDHVSRLRREGMARDEALLLGARDRLRPILMTVATTVLGMVPLSMGKAAVGGDGPPYYPMARAIIGGLAFSTVVSLIVLPSIYLWLDDLANWGRRVLTRARAMAPVLTKE